MTTDSIPTMSPKTKSERNQGIDVARGLLMFYIVFIIHGFFWLNLVPEMIRSNVLFEMSLVFIISGYAFNLAESNKKAKAQPVGFKAYLKFMLARLSRILLPYFAYAMACILICFVHSQSDSKSTWQLSQIVADWLNPFADRSRYKINFIDWHLWFIPPFLLITAVLPFTTKLKLSIHAPLWLIMLGATIAVYLLSLCNFSESALLKSVFFYLLWAIFGYHIATVGINAYKADYLKIAIISIAGLLIIFSLNADSRILIMQHNKFPPNAVYFLFNCIWVTFFLALATIFQSQSQDISRYLAKQWWFKPFIFAGYSIYLWQGIGYFIASKLAYYFGLPILITWITALLCTVALGLLASPIERIRIRF
jgi:peptidoglycan/LPS O-acetylase OafA/YrhL